MVRVGIGGRIHDEARVVSANFSLSPKGGLAPLRDRLAEQLDMTVRWAEENGAFIGHVKAYIRWGEAEALMLSTTGEGTQAKGSGDRRYGDRLRRRARGRRGAAQGLGGGRRGPVRGALRF